MFFTRAQIEQHGLTPDEYARIVGAIGREPNLTELGIFSVMWSEHCSYKSSKIFLRTLPSTGPHVLQGPGENAGIIDFGDGLGLVFKMESHNHPSFIEPYQGAATGVGGILRDVFTMGARPIANLNSLRFGAVDHPKTPYLVKGVVAGIGGYGNCMGIATVGGEVYFDPCYNGNILVNAMTVGLVRTDRIFRGTAHGIGNPVIYVGSKTGRDGIHGATMASDVFGGSTCRIPIHKAHSAAEGGVPGQTGSSGARQTGNASITLPLEGATRAPEIDERRPTVQVGDPFTEKLLLEACCEAFATGAIVGIQDMGAAGLTSSAFEMCARGAAGLAIDLDLVPQRETGMTPYEIMLSESQERMLMVVTAGREAEVLAIYAKWDLDAIVIGRVTDTGRVVATSGGAVALDLPVAPVVHEAPVYDRPRRRPAWQDRVQTLDVAKIPLPADYTAVLRTLLCAPNIASRQWIYHQYDHMVGTDTVVLPGSDAAVLRVKGRVNGVAVSVDCNSRYCYLDPYWGAALAVAEAARNVVCSGARPVGCTDCLNFGSPEDPEILWQFEQAILGLSEAARQFGTPVVSGNVSFYNHTSGTDIYPTPTIGMVGIIDDVTKACRIGFCGDGDVILLLGAHTDELGGSEYLSCCHGRAAGHPPTLDFDRERAVQRACLIGIERGVVRSAHDCSEGGLAVALAESAVADRARPIGARIALPTGGVRPDALLFGEAASRIVVTTRAADAELLLTIAKELGCPASRLGTVGGDRLMINEWINISVAEIADLWWNSLEQKVSLVAGDQRPATSD